MQEDKKENKVTDFLFIVFFLFLIFGISMFNFIVDPYHIFRKSTIEGFNNIKTHKYSNKRTMVIPHIKISHKNKDIAFVGNCLLSHYSEGLDNIAFYTITVAETDEIATIIKNIHEIAPNIKKIYWGIFFDDLYYKDAVFDSLEKNESPNLQLNDLINLFFSWNTTKYSIETVKDSIKNKGDKSQYIYLYREIAPRHYEKAFDNSIIDKIKNIYNYTKENNIELVLYYSPMHITKKMDMYLKNIWDTNIRVKKEIAQIVPFYDYSLANTYNTQPLDETSIYFVDNIHPTEMYNDMVVNDLLAETKQQGILITKDNVDKYNSLDTAQLKAYMKKHKELTNKIKQVKPEDINERVQKLENN
ncbi:hypothetical protein IJD44_07350 [bacterium]|nr:hypothetical protein [bacterium]